jgi:small GTP-binding protein
MNSFNVGKNARNSTSNEIVSNCDYDYENEPYEVLPEGSVYDYTFKVIIVGNSGVGKSCMAIKAINNIFQDHSIPTVGFEFFSVCFKIRNKITKLQIWDTCGQEVYKSLVGNFYRNSHIAIIVYSIVDRKSFEDVSNWIEELKSNTSNRSKKFLVGNKSDLPNRKISTEEGELLKEEHNLDGYFENSCKTGNSSIEIFSKAAKILLKENDKKKEESKNSNSFTEDKINEISKAFYKNDLYENNERPPKRRVSDSFSLIKYRHSKDKGKSCVC